ncbi:winged helix-turn-helix transcriptional regulator [Roseospirillum parvum]|uniref:Winged helix-turn-helix DNA-binding n=1 Tax=Roseospirillum parvum TaxID=83401 RepID=A0A1G7WWX1_9PROT|nr:winged helix-turn-helix transcriptional regulator [Roseospirillum parvum]SDG76427.1 Winged helix-turn-helix DNA-binding [Roseospirillum parvum]
MERPPGDPPPPPGDDSAIDAGADTGDGRAFREVKDGLHGELRLKLLSQLEHDGALSQAELGRRLGIATGLVNAFIKRCATKGLVKIRSAPRRRYAYYLTPKGLAEKGRLTVSYLSSSLRFFRRARTQCLELLRHCEAQGLTRVALVGRGELAEIAFLASRETGVEIVGIVLPGSNEPHCHGFPVLPDLPGPEVADAVLITDVADPEGSYRSALAHLPAERVLAPAVLHLSPVADP